MSENNDKKNLKAEKKSSAKTEASLKTENSAVPAKNSATKTENKKNISRKKIPSLFKKSYAPKKFDKKILKKISIPQDLDFVKSIFKEGTDLKKSENLKVPEEMLFSKAELKKLKILAKEIKGQKGRFKLLPLTATLCAFAAFIIVVNVFKNPLAKKIIKSACQSIFSAKTDIEKVEVSFLDSHLAVTKIQIGNKNSEYKNLFEAQKIDLNFNLAKALRGYFDAENIEVSGIAFNTDRSTSCLLPVKEKEEKKQNEDSAFMTELNKKTQTALEDLKLQMQTAFGEVKVDSIVENINSSLKTPATSQKLILSAQEMVQKWQETPAELESKINDFSSSVKELESININKISEVTVLKSNLEKINSAIKNGQTLKSSVEKISSDVKTDAASISALSDELKNAVSSDKKFAQEKINDALDTAKNAKSIFTNALDTVAYDYLGKFYPFAKKMINYGLEIKNNAKVQKLAAEASKLSASSKNSKSKEKAPKSQKKEGSRRLKGSTLTFGEEYPKFLVERIAASGEGFSAEVKNLSSNQDFSGKTTSATAKFTLSDVSHSASVVFDARSYSTEPLISLDYTGSGFTTDFDGTKIALSSGIPTVHSRSALSVSASFDENKFAAKGDIALNPVTLSSDGFGNEIIDKYYNTALSSVTKINSLYEISYSENAGLDFNLSGNFADSFVAALKKLALSAGSDIKDSVLAKINDSIENSSEESNAAVSKFNEIASAINLNKTSLENIQSSLDSKKKEIEAKIAESAKSEAKKAAGSALKGLLKQ